MKATAEGRTLCRPDTIGPRRLIAIVMSAFEALEFIDWFRAAFAGWRFLFSSAYRAQTRERWRYERVWYVVWDVLCGLAGIAFSLLVAWFLMGLFAGWNWLQKVL